MSNRVLAGRFKGRRIVLRRGVPAVVLGLRQSLPLTQETVAQMQVLYIHWRPGALSGWGRGLAGGLLGRTLYFSAIRSARRIPTFTCRLHFRDGSVALVRLEERLFLALSAVADVNAPSGQSEGLPPVS